MFKSVLTSLMVIVFVSGVACQPSKASDGIAASADQIKPLRAGQLAPAFVVRAADNSEFYFDPKGLKRPALLITFRGGWCPYCNMHLSELRTVVPEISALGIDVLFLSGDRPEMLYASLEADTQTDIANLGYRIYSDADAQAAIALGVAFQASERTINRRKEKGQDITDSSMLTRGVLPVPAVYAVDQSGAIRFDFVAADYKVRLPAAELLAVAKELAENVQ